MSATTALAALRDQLQSFLDSDFQYEELKAEGYIGTVMKRTDGWLSAELGLGNTPYVVLSIFNAKTSGFEYELYETFYDLAKTKFKIIAIYPMVAWPINNWISCVDGDGVCHSYRLSDVEVK